MAVTEAEPEPTDDILTDPQAYERYNNAVESWGLRLRAAGLRLCNFFKDTGMKGLDCPK